MGKITFTNKTDVAVIAEWQNGQVRIEPRTKQAIEAEMDSMIRIYKDKPSSRLCFARCLSRESVKNVWRFGPIVLVGFDSFLKASGGNERIEITEKTHSSLFSLFGMLYFNGGYADSYDYHELTDRKNVQMLSAICLLPFAILSMVLLIACIYGLITEFSFESFLILLLCSVPTIVTSAMIKSINKFINFKKHFPENMKDAKETQILSDNGKTVKYSISRN